MSDYEGGDDAAYPPAATDHPAAAVSAFPSPCAQVPADVHTTGLLITDKHDGASLIC